MRRDRRPDGPEYAVVVPTVGRPTLTGCSTRPGRSEGPDRPREVVVVDDRPGDRRPGARGARRRRRPVPVRIVLGPGRGPGRGPQPRLARVAGPRGSLPGRRRGAAGRLGARARRATSAAAPSRASPACRAGSEVPAAREPPADRLGARRPPGCEHGALGHRRHGLSTRGARRGGRRLRRAVPARLPRGRRPRAARLATAGWPLAVGGRARSRTRCGRPDAWVSVRVQRGNADDALMRRAARAGLARAGAEAGRGGCPGTSRPSAALQPAAAGRCRGLRGARGGRDRRRSVAGARPADFLRRRIAPGPARRRRGAPRWSCTSAVIPLAAVRPPVRGCVAAPATREPWPPPRAGGAASTATARSSHDVPYNGDPELVRPVDGRRGGRGRLRQRGHSVGVVTQPVGRRPRPAQHGRRASGQRAVDAGCSGRSTPGRSARTRPTTAARAASRGPAWCCAAARRLGVDADECAWSATSAPTSGARRGRGGAGRSSCPRP